jgi:hypothetical protein
MSHLVYIDIVVSGGTDCVFGVWLTHIRQEYCIYQWIICINLYLRIE